MSWRLMELMPTQARRYWTSSLTYPEWNPCRMRRHRSGTKDYGASVLIVDPADQIGAQATNLCSGPVKTDIQLSGNSRSPELAIESRLWYSIFPPLRGVRAAYGSHRGGSPCHTPSRCPAACNGRQWFFPRCRLPVGRGHFERRNKSLCTDAGRKRPSSHRIRSIFPSDCFI